MHDLEDRLRAALAKHAADVDQAPEVRAPTPGAGNGTRARKAVALLVALGFAGGVLAAGLWVADLGNKEPAPAEESEREVIREARSTIVR